MPRGTDGRFYSIDGESASDRFWAKVQKTNECWLWTGAHNEKGYGYFDYAGQSIRVHRFAYNLLVGPIPNGLELDHLCHNRVCVNPLHLEAVSHKVNLSRAIGNFGNHQLRKTHCPQEHPYDLFNTYYDKRGKRYCRICKVQGQRISNRKVIKCQT